MLRQIRTNDKPINLDGRWVLYWMTSARRANYNNALERALTLSQELKKPLLVLEPIRCDYRHASDRIHAFVIDGMKQNRRAFAKRKIGYLPCVEREPGQIRDLFLQLVDESCAVVADYFPIAWLQKITLKFCDQSEVACEVIDSNGVVPVAASEHVYQRAYGYRRFAMGAVLNLDCERPNDDPARDIAIEPFADDDYVREIVDGLRLDAFDIDESDLSELPIDHSVLPVELKGGPDVAHARLFDFITHKISSYGEGRNHPDDECQSYLSSYLHFGHISSWEILDAIGETFSWSFDQVTIEGKAWAADSFLHSFIDQLLTWRELGFHFCHNVEAPWAYNSLPPWASRTLDEHTGDTRDWNYTIEDLEQGLTHDEVWNAAQNQLRTEGIMHNYLRMLWGKRILEWMPDPQHALQAMFHLNNKFALDGRDPNSVSGITWVMGRFDRAWGPERPIYGKIRYMSSANTLKKLRMRDYLAQYSLRS